MSWTQFTDNIVANTAADMAALVALDNNAIYGATGITISAEEAAKLTALVSSEAAQSAAAMSGVYLGGEKYMYVNNTDGVINLKKSSGGAVLAKSNKLVVVVAWKPSDTPVANAQIFPHAIKFAKQLADNGY